MSTRALHWLFAALCFAPVAAFATDPPAPRPNGVFLVARESLLDPNFRETAVLATQTPDGGTVGVVLNRPTKLDLARFFREPLPAENYRDRVFAGGPVMRQVLVAVFESATPPGAAAFRVQASLWLTMDPGLIEGLLAGHAGRYRLYAGFAGWAPRQLEGELLRAGWHVLPADAETVFRADTGTLWQDLINRVRATQTRAPQRPPALHHSRFGAPQKESPAGAGL